jgi:hypothetical protein
VITFDAEAAGRAAGAVSQPPVATETLQHQLYGAALAVMRRRHVGEDKQFHFGLAV